MQTPRSTRDIWSFRSRACAAILGLAAAMAPADDLIAQVAPDRVGSPGAVLDSILATPPLDRAHWGVVVYDMADGSPVLRHNARRLFTAASTMKLVTAAAALNLLGATHWFETTVDAVGEGGRIDSLVVRGAGDPTMGDPFFPSPLAPLDSLADSLAARGLRRVAGPLVIDQSRFDSVLTHPAWERFDLDWYYAAPVVPFAVMSAAVEVVVMPGAVGKHARVSVPHARELIDLDARIRTVGGSEDWDDVLRRPPGTDSLVLRGTIGVGAGPDTSWIAQTDPGRTAGRAFRRALARAGIAVDGPVLVRYHDAGRESGGIRALERVPGEPKVAPGKSGAGDGGSGYRVVWRSPSLDTIIRLAIERSDNWVTEQVLKTLAATVLGQGSWSGGTDLVEQYMVETVGVPADAIYMRDGSGLTPQGLLTPDVVVALLRHAAEQPWGAAFRSALASPGEPESTLDDRLLSYRGRVSAKTGTLRHVNALSGYLQTRDGRELVFSILSNGSGQPSWVVQTAIDRIVESLIESGS